MLGLIGLGITIAIVAIGLAATWWGMRHPVNVLRPGEGDDGTGPPDEEAMMTPEPRRHLTPDITAELARIRAEISALRQQQQAARMRHGWMSHIITDLETDPHLQYRVHLYGVVYWLINFPLVAALFFGLPSVWLKWGVFITLVYSIYANLATDYGAMSAAMAAYGQNPLPEIPVEQHVPAPAGPDDRLGHGDGPVETRGD